MITPSSHPRQVRLMLDRILRSNEDFDAFCIDYFPEVFRRFASEMNRVSKTNLLLNQIPDSSVILAKLKDAHPEHEAWADERSHVQGTRDKSWVPYALLGCILLSLIGGAWLLVRSRAVPQGAAPPSPAPVPVPASASAPTGPGIPDSPQKAVVADKTQTGTESGRMAPDSAASSVTSIGSGNEIKAQAGSRVRAGISGTKIPALPRARSGQTLQIGSGNRIEAGPGSHVETGIIVDQPLP